MPESSPSAPVKRSHTNVLRALGIDELKHLLESAAGRALVSVAAGIALFTLVGLAVLWPDRHAPRGGEPEGRLIPAKVVQVLDTPCTPGASQACRNLTVEVEGRTTKVSLGVVGRVPAVGVGDHIRVTRPGPTDIRPSAGQPVHYEFAGFDRRGPVIWLGVVLAVAAAALLRWRGVLAVVGVGLSLAILLAFLVPSILGGASPVLCGLTASLAVMFVTLVLTNGIGVQTLTASVGIAFTLGLSCALAWMALRFTHLDGSVDPTLVSLRTTGSPLPLLGVTLGAILIGALGVLADTGVTQASAVMALRTADPAMRAPELYRSAFVIGRDHLSATIHTLVLAYAGSVLTVLLLLSASGATTITALNSLELAEPIVATVVGCLALLVAVPLTTGLASIFIARVPVELLPAGHHHHHH
jgi:uncharacterized membrane protein